MYVHVHVHVHVKINVQCTNMNKYMYTFISTYMYKYMYTGHYSTSIVHLYESFVHQQILMKMMMTSSLPLEKVPSINSVSMKPAHLMTRKLTLSVWVSEPRGR